MILRTIAAIAFVLLPSLAFAQAEPKPEDETLQISPNGRPSAYGKLKGPRLFIWYDDDGWHLRMVSAKQSHRFTGLIRVTTGKITKLQGIGSLEAGGGRVRGDIGRISDAGRKVTFSFGTKGGEDGLDLQLSKDARLIQFELLLDGLDHPERISLGKESQSPPKSKFVYPADPSFMDAAATQEPEGGDEPSSDGAKKKKGKRKR